MPFVRAYYSGTDSPSAHLHILSLRLFSCFLPIVNPVPDGSHSLLVGISALLELLEPARPSEFKAPKTDS